MSIEIQMVEQDMQHEFNKWLLLICAVCCVCVYVCVGVCVCCRCAFNTLNRVVFIVITWLLRCLASNEEVDLINVAFEQKGMSNSELSKYAPEEEGGVQGRGEEGCKGGGKRGARDGEGGCE